MHMHFYVCNMRIHVHVVNTYTHMRTCVYAYTNACIRIYMYGFRTYMASVYTNSLYRYGNSIHVYLCVHVCVYT